MKNPIRNPIRQLALNQTNEVDLFTFVCYYTLRDGWVFGFLYSERRFMHQSMTFPGF